MSRGKANANYLNREGLVAHSDAPNYDFLYSASTVKDPQWNIGDRVVLGDGRVFRYAKSSGTCYAAHGAAFHDTRAIERTTVAAAQAIGDKQVTIASQTFALDELRGGYVTCFGTSNANVQFRGIIGNTACSGSTITIYVDAPLVKALEVTYEIMVTSNIYSNMELNAGQEQGYTAIGGVPAVYVSAADMYFWLQTWGPCFCVATEHLGDTDGDQQCVFTSEGALRRIATAYVETHGYQAAGFLITEGRASLGWNEQIVMLQISP